MTEGVSLHYKVGSISKEPYLHIMAGVIMVAWRDVFKGNPEEKLDALDWFAHGDGLAIANLMLGSDVVEEMKDKLFDNWLDNFS